MRDAIVAVRLRVMRQTVVSFLIVDLVVVVVLVVTAPMVHYAVRTGFREPEDGFCQSL